MGWLITLGILVLLALLPVGARFRYNDQGIHLTAEVGFLSIPILPKKKKSKKAVSSPKKKKKASGTPKKAPDKPAEKGGSWTDFLPLVKIVLDFLGGFFHRLRIDHLELKLILAGDDPCDLAIHYGRAWEALGNLIPQLERVFTIRRRKLEVECDFEGDSTRVIAGAKLTIALGELLYLMAILAFRGLREYRKIKQKRKGGAAK